MLDISWTVLKSLSAQQKKNGMFKHKCLNAKLAITSKQFRGDLGEGGGVVGEFVFI